ncbi:MAG: MazG nucleotide pyrophosphohydrolase domain-containing protein [Dethiobacteria bacterium]
MEQLRLPQGCPWDRQQDHNSLRPYLLEETFEVLDAINNGGAAELCEELGDLLLQIVFPQPSWHLKGRNLPSGRLLMG